MPFIKPDRPLEAEVVPSPSGARETKNADGSGSRPTVMTLPPEAKVVVWPVEECEDTTAEARFDMTVRTPGRKAAKMKNAKRPISTVSMALYVAFGTVLFGFFMAFAMGAFNGKPKADSAGGEKKAAASNGTKPNPAKEPEPRAVVPVPPADPKPGEERSFEIAPGVKMVFCWIPPGTATLGSPTTEVGRSLYEPEHTYTSKGYWLGKYAVTQEEWKAVMGNNPSYFDGTNANKAKGMGTARFPVENVSWNDCGEFLGKLSARSGATMAFGKPGRFVLPHEDEWEYACRGGKSNQQPFYYGGELNGTQANCDGNYPSGTTVKGPYLERTARVGSYERMAPHPWGLCDMSGNVFQWCENMYTSEQARRVLRGGSWSTNLGRCRAACRGSLAPESRRNLVGFRVCVRLD